MAQKEFRTYRRRETTRKSGNHTCGETTGGECIIRKSEKIIQKNSLLTLVFVRENLELTELFEKEIGIIAFGGCIQSGNAAYIDYHLNLTIGNQEFEYSKSPIRPLDAHTWSNVGFHKEISLDNFPDGKVIVNFAKVTMNIRSIAGNELQFISFDFDAVRKDAFRTAALADSFHQKTAMPIPHLYYLNPGRSIRTFLSGDTDILPGQPIVLKSCNRCGRFLPLDPDNELNTLSFSLHCKKKAPCTHPSFRAYTILNYSELEEDDLKNFTIVKSADKFKVVSYFGHQLECKACKKFFVNTPLNPQRNPQQFKEDSLRRRATEILVNELLGTNLVHFEFEKRTKNQFSQYIWKKFGRRCFKCQTRIPFEEMHLDHTMPLAYLYRLDESATCLCSHHNSQKRDHFPADFYTEEELERLSSITGLSLAQLHSREVNETVLSLLTERVVWYFDEFLMREEYQKVRDGILTADKIHASLKRVIAGKVNLEEEYRRICGHYPLSVTIGE